jgi:uncharacterized protein YceH (UPF0502 family)
VSGVESGEIEIKAAQRKYGIQGDATIKTWIEKFGDSDWENKSDKAMSKSKEQKLMELEAKVKLLEEQKASLEKRLDFSDKKVIFLI